MTISTTGSVTTSIKPGPDGGMTGNYLDIASPANGKYTGSVVLAFSAAVSNVLLTLGDIDASSGNTFQESAYLSSGFTIVSQGSNLTGNGTSASPWVAKAGVAVPSNSTAGNAAVRYTGSLTSITISYADVVNSSSVHSIDLFDLSFIGC